MTSRREFLALLAVLVPLRRLEAGSPRRDFWAFGPRAHVRLHGTEKIVQRKTLHVRFTHTERVHTFVNGVRVK